MLQKFKIFIKNRITDFKLFIKYFSGVISLIVYSIAIYFEDKRGRKRIHQVLTMQIFFTGVQALTIISLVALALGAITVMQLFTQLSKIGALDWVGKILDIVIIRELGPIITAFIVISRSGTAIVTEIGTMMINEEINALEMLGINTLQYVVFPRIVGVTFSLFLLTIYFNAIGLFGGFLVGYIYGGITFDMFMSYVINSISYMDIFISLLKSICFGLFIASISIYYGFQCFVQTLIPYYAGRAVVSNISALFIFDILITLMFIL